MGLGQLGAVVGHQVEDLDGVGVAVVGACGHSGAVAPARVRSPKVGL